MRVSALGSVGISPMLGTRQGQQALMKTLVAVIPAEEEWVGPRLQRHASVLTPSMFMAQLPQMPSRQLLRKVKVGSTSFLIRISASKTIGPVLSRSKVKDCIFGFEVGRSGDHR